MQTEMVNANSADLEKVEGITNSADLEEVANANRVG